MNRIKLSLPRQPGKVAKYLYMIEIVSISLSHPRPDPTSEVTFGLVKFIVYSVHICELINETIYGVNQGFIQGGEGLEFPPSPPSYKFPYPEILKLSMVIRESVDSLCRDGADAQYMQYLSKSRITSPQTR